MGAGLRLRAWAAVCRGGPWPSRGCLRRRRVPRLTTDLPLVVGADSIAARGRSRRRGVRRDGASRPTAARKATAIRFHHAPAPVGPNIKIIRRGGIYPARGCLRYRRVPGTMQASSPTEVCDTISATVSRLAAGPPSVVGADSISARGPCAAAGCGGMRASRPTAARKATAIRFHRAPATVGLKHKIYS